MDIRRRQAITHHRLRGTLALTASLLLLLSACAGETSPSPSGSAAAPSGSASAGLIKVFGAYATQIEEPWDGVIHSALEAEAAAGRIEYTFADDIGYAGDMERVLRETAEQDAPDIIFGDGFGNEEAVRTVAADYPEIAFVFGSGGGPDIDVLPPQLNFGLVSLIAPARRTVTVQ